MDQKILIVEDDKNLSRLVKYNLDKAGFVSIAVASGEEAFQTLDRFGIDLILLDVMLPKMDGFEVCKRIKADNKLSKIPVVMLTARGEEVDRIVGLEIGADDYIVKPFSVRELILRIKGILKRKVNPEENIKEILEFDDLKIDIPRHKVSVKNKEMELTSLEFRLLETLLRRRGRVQSRDQLLNDVWNISAEVTTRTIDTHIKRLRQKLGKMGDHIITVRGYGYKFSDASDD